MAHASEFGFLLENPRKRKRSSAGKKRRKARRAHTATRRRRRASKRPDATPTPKMAKRRKRSRSRSRRALRANPFAPKHRKRRRSARRHNPFAIGRSGIAGDLLSTTKQAGMLVVGDFLNGVTFSLLRKQNIGGQGPLTATTMAGLNAGIALLFNLGGRFLKIPKAIAQPTQLVSMFAALNALTSNFKDKARNAIGLSDEIEDYLMTGVSDYETEPAVGDYMMSDDEVSDEYTSLPY